MVRTRSDIRNNPTVIDLKQQARSAGKLEWLAYYETLVEAIRKKEIKDYFIGQTVGSDEIEEDKLRLFIRLLYGFPLEEYVPIVKKVPIVTLLLVKRHQLLPTLMVPSRASKSNKLRVLLDTGSTSSFIMA